MRGLQISVNGCLKVPEFYPLSLASSFFHPCSNVSLPSKSNEKRTEALTVDSVNLIAGKNYQEHDSPIPSPTDKKGNSSECSGTCVLELYENKRNHVVFGNKN
jgi:hypothetical protein